MKSRKVAASQTMTGGFTSMGRSLPVGKTKERRSLADEVASRVRPSKPATWLDGLDAESQAEVLDTRRRFHAGVYGDASSSAIATALIEIAKENGWRIIAKKGLSEWLRKK